MYVSWICCRCNTADFHDSLFGSYLIRAEMENPFSVLAGLNENSIASLNRRFNPRSASSPKNRTKHSSEALPTSKYSGDSSRCTGSNDRHSKEKAKLAHRDNKL